MGSSDDRSDGHVTDDTRRQFLRTGLGLAAGAAALALPRVAVADGEEKQTESQGPAHIIDGTTDPFPIPWLDRNGSHSQVPAPDQEPAHIFHFRGDVARCNGFSGMGTDGHGNRLRFGGATTDIGLMRGEYVATDGTRRTGAFLHL